MDCGGTRRENNSRPPRFGFLSSSRRICSCWSRLSSDGRMLLVGTYVSRETTPEDEREARKILRRTNRREEKVCLLACYGGGFFSSNKACGGQACGVNKHTTLLSLLLTKLLEPKEEALKKSHSYFDILKSMSCCCKQVETLMC